MTNVSPETFRKISAYVAELPARVLVTLVHGISAAAATRDLDTAEEMILSAARGALSRQGDWGEAVSNPRGLAFHELKPFTIDVATAAKLPGRIEAKSINRIWTELNRSSLATPPAALATQAARAISDDPEAFTDIVHLMRPGLEAQLEALHTRISGEPGARARLSAQIGGIRVADDLADMLHAVRVLPRLDEFCAWTDEKIAGGGRLSPALAQSAADMLAELHDKDLVVALLLLLDRCMAPGSLVTLLVSQEQSDKPEELMRSRFAVIVDILLGELEVLTRRVEKSFSSPQSIPVNDCLERFHDIASGLDASIDLDVASAWAKELGRHRSAIADVLREPLETLPGRLRRCVQSGARGAQHLDAFEAESTLSCVEMLAAIKPMRAGFALNDCVTRVDAAISTLIDTAAEALPQQARSADATALAELSRSFDILVRAACTLFGDEYANLLRRSGEVAGLSVALEANAAA